MSTERRRSPRAPVDQNSVLIPAVEAAKHLGIPYTTLRDIVRRGQISVVRIGEAWYFDRKDLIGFVQRSKETLGNRR